ncbi:MAG TPA: hypothetical protein VE010_15675 [Thermoanaerobaculia bacterium]|nr:hypothetical protein [Thermoanaerobaculia bacterium]
MTRTFLIALIALNAVTLAASALAQDAPAQFLIERIEVREVKRVTSDVIVAESRLREGEAYSEAELSDAAARLSRLPFLLSADFALEKGSERGRHVLVITVAETKPFFYLLDIRPILSDRSSEGQLDLDFSDRIGGDQEGVVGARWFVGRRGAFHAGLFTRDDRHEFTQDYTAAVIGYTQYDILGTRAFATITLKRALLDVPVSDVVSPQLVVGIPVSPKQTVTLTYDETRFDGDLRVVNGASFQRYSGERLVSARWSYNTTNHPFLPTRGTVVSVTPGMAWRDNVNFGVVAGGPADEPILGPVAFHTNSFGVSVDMARYFELSEQSSVSVGAEAGWGQIDERNSGLMFESDRNPTFAAAQIGYSHSLWTREQQKRGDSRFEYQLGYITRDRDFDRPVGPPVDDEHGELQASFAWVRRSSFGTIRLGVGYGW